MKRPRMILSAMMAITLAVFLTSFHSEEAKAGPGPCTAPDNGTGTAKLPADCPYTSPYEELVIIDGLPPGTTIEIPFLLDDFLNVLEGAGGTLGGTLSTADATLYLYNMEGTGSLAGFSRNIQMPVSAEIHWGPRTLGDPVQTFAADWYRLQGSIVGDPDFDLLTFTAGTDYGLPSPGQTTLTELPSGDYNVDSFFDITYQITFVGAAGSVLDGMAGTTTGTIRIVQGAPPLPPETPSFSLSGLVPSTAPPDAILQLNPVLGAPPVVAIPGPNLGIGVVGFDDLNSLSYGMEYPNNVSEWLRFSMAPDPTGMWDGLPGTDVNAESTCLGAWPGQAIGDEFDAPMPPPPPGVGNTNTLVLDENGVQDAPVCAAPPGYPVGTALPAPGAPVDDMDALEDRPPSFVDDGSGGGIAGDAIPDRPVYFTLAPGSAAWPSSADILFSVGVPPGPFMYAPAAALGLIGIPGGPPAGDAIDALMLYDNGNMVFDSGDWVWFSLAPGSPSLVAPFSEGDVLFVDGAAPGAFTAQYFADQLGLESWWLPVAAPPDDVNALKGEIPCMTGPDSDDEIGNGNGVPASDVTVPFGEVPAAIDCVDTDDDNDHYPDQLELVLPDASCPAKTAITSPGGDITYDDDANGTMLDGSDDGPSWDSDGDTVLDGIECGLGTDPANAASKPTVTACGGTGDFDGDGLRDAWEVCKWGTAVIFTDTDLDGLGDCVEAADVNGDGVVNFVGDVILYAQAALLPPATFGQDGDFDINGDGVVNFVGDVIQEAQFGLIPGLCLP